MREENYFLYSKKQQTGKICEGGGRKALRKKVYTDRHKTIHKTNYLSGLFERLCHVRKVLET